MVLSEGDTQISNNNYLRCIEKAKTRTCYCGIQTDIEGEYDSSSTAVEDFFVTFLGFIIDL